jgi:cell division protein FtsW
MIAGTFTAILAYKFPLDKLRFLITPAYAVVLGLLIIVLLLPGEINGAKLWIRIGPMSLQPSEFAKPVLIVYLAAVLAKPWSMTKKNTSSAVQDYINQRLLPFCFITLPISFLVLIGNDLATAALIFGIGLVVFFLSDSNTIHNLFNIIAGGVGTALGIFFTVSEPYRMARLARHLDFTFTGQITDPLNTGYQLRQILIAVATGGLFGYGFGQSRQKYFYLQDTAFTDTIFAVIAEEFGFIGSILVIIGFMLLVFRAIKIAQASPNKFYSLIAAGVGIWIFFQSFIHLAVNVGLIPLTGMTLPLMSYGGSSLIATLAGVGLLLNVSKHVKLD